MDKAKCIKFCYFTKFLRSGYCGYAKPDERIYKILLEKTKVRAEETVFIDDKEQLLVPAKRIGYKTILFKDKQQLEGELKEYGFIL